MFDSTNLLVDYILFALFVLGLFLFIFNRQTVVKFWKEFGCWPEDESSPNLKVLQFRDVIEPRLRKKLSEDEKMRAALRDIDEKIRTQAIDYFQAKDRRRQAVRQVQQAARALLRAQKIAEECGFNLRQMYQEIEKFSTEADQATS